MADTAELHTLLEGFRATSTASVADAVDRVVQRPGFMSHEIKPILPGRVVGPAVTMLERAALEAQPPLHALQAIDEARAGSIIVIGLDDPGSARNVAQWGGLMAAAAAMTARIRESGSILQSLQEFGRI